MIFDIENSLWNSDVITLQQSGKLRQKAFQDAYNPG